MDNVTPKKRSNIMSKVRSKDSNLELSIRRILFKKGFRYRKNVARLYGKPDIAFISKKTVIFIDSCFWHGCSKHCRMPKSNKSYWIKKIGSNIKRDKIVNKYYKENKWNVLRYWEHQFKESDKIIDSIVKNLQ